MFPEGVVPASGGGPCAAAVAVVMSNPTTTHCHPRKENMMVPPFAAFVALVNATCVPEEVRVPMQDSKCIDFHARVLPRQTPKIHRSHSVALRTKPMELASVRGMPLANFTCEMSFLRIAEWGGGGVLGIGIGVGLAWIGIVEGAGYGIFLQGGG